MNLLHALVIGFWTIIPAYTANAFAPLANGKRRMDFGLEFLGNELFGGGKTWEGFGLAIAAGTLAGAAEILTQPYLNSIAVEEGFQLPHLSPFLVFFIAFGAMLGDLVASFFKRRAGLERGASAPLLDQLDFLIGGFLAGSLFLGIPLESVLLFVVITPIVHYASSVIGHKLGAKEVPW